MATLADEIEVEAARIRAAWSEGERMNRAAGNVLRTVAGSANLTDDERQKARERGALAACYGRPIEPKRVRPTRETLAIERAVRELSGDAA